MNVLDIYCYNSFSSAWIECPMTQETYHLFVGNRGNCRLFSYLYFDLPPLQTLGSIQSVSLCLFHTPLYPFHPAPHTCILPETYLLYPLKDFYTQYSYPCPPVPDYANGQLFYVMPHCTATEIDVTNLAKKWLTGELSNKGLVLLGTSSEQMIAYGSYYSKQPDIVPFIRISYLPIALAETHVIAPGTTLDLTTSSKVYIDPV